MAVGASAVHPGGRGRRGGGKKHTQGPGQRNGSEKKALPLEGEQPQKEESRGVTENTGGEIFSGVGGG